MALSVVMAFLWVSQVSESMSLLCRPAENKQWAWDPMPAR